MKQADELRRTFDTPNGTRGARKPSGRFYRLMNTMMERRVRRKGGSMMGFKVLILMTKGRKSGLERSNPVGWFEAKDGNWLIVASAAGAAENPAWYYNLAAAPDTAVVSVDGWRIEVVAEQLHGHERDEAWQQITAASPRFGKYQEKTDRQIPVIHLVPRQA